MLEDKTIYLINGLHHMHLLGENLQTLWQHLHGNMRTPNQVIEFDSHKFYPKIEHQSCIACIVVEMGSHPTKRFLFNHTTPFSTKGLEKSLCDFTGTIFVQCENPFRKTLGAT